METLTRANMFGFETKTIDPEGIDKWQVHDGYSWTHYFDTCEQAENFAKKMNKNRVGKLVAVDDKFTHRPDYFLEEVY